MATNLETRRASTPLSVKAGQTLGYITLSLFVFIVIDLYLNAHLYPLGALGALMTISFIALSNISVDAMIAVSLFSFVLLGGFVYHYSEIVFQAPILIVFVAGVAILLLPTYLTR